MSKFVATFILSLVPLMCFGQSVDDELLAAFNQDQSSRSKGGVGDPCGDETRRLRVLQLLAEGRVATADDRYHAAMILQHTPQGMVGTETASKSAENYLLAHFLAKAAAESGHDDARWLAAATYDRYLVSQGLPQKYGTQFSLNHETGFFEFDPVDPKTTDAERREWDVPPVEDTLRRFEESGMGTRPRKSLTLAELSCSDPATALP
ncbi:MAG: DUF6624 domain-containing protein [Gammaproteobacteria bacterium]